MAKKKSGETSIPLIIALVFFILSTIGLGVFTYTLMQEQDTLRQAKTRAEKDQKDLTAAAADEALVAKVYRVYIGVDEPDDRTSVFAETAEGSKAAQALKQINEGVAKKLGVDVDKLPKEYAFWPAEFSEGSGAVKKTVKLPVGVGGLISVATTATTERDKTAKTVDQPKKDYEAAQKDMAASTTAKAEDSKTLKKVAETLPNTNKAAIAKAQKTADDNNARYLKDVKVVRDAEAVAKADLIQKSSELAEAQKKVDEAQKKLSEIQVANKKKMELLQYDEPQGKILRRLSDDVVEIDLGSGMRVRPGLTFTVLPYDFPEKGRQSRMFEERIPDEHGRYHSVAVFHEKAIIEVIEVLGPSLSRARILQGSSFNPIRDGVIAGDLLYNKVWRKGVADHIALIGIFDINGDGTDDIETVIKDMTKMGIPVDGYFDLKTKKWVGQVNEQTRYLIIGAFPSPTLNDPNLAAKTELIKSLNDALEKAKQGGVVDSSYRDFFPKMGYRVAPNVPADKTNQAANRYLTGQPAVEAKEPGK